MEGGLVGADLGVGVTNQILAAVKPAYETQGRGGLRLFEIAQREVENSLSSKDGALRKQPAGLTVVSIVGVNGSGKTTTSAKLAKLIQSRGETVLLAAGRTFRAPAIAPVQP